MEIDFSAPFELRNLKATTEFDERVIIFLEEWFSQSSTVEVQTSGSTGTPKKFQIEKQRMLHSAMLTCDFLDLKPGDTGLLCLPIEYISGKMMIVRSLARHLKLTTVNPSTTPLKNLDQNFDFCAMTPLQVENSIAKIHQLKRLIIGGAAVSNHLSKELRGQPCSIFETYGMSETLSHIALKEINPNPKDYFTLFEGIDISTDARGCLRINAPALNPSVLQTNDIVEIKKPNQFKFLGRADNIINSGGAKIYPEILEKIVKAQIDKEVIFIGLPHEVWGQRLTLVIEEPSSDKVELISRGNTSGIAQRKTILDQIVALSFEKSFYKPKLIIFLPKIPRTPNGKVSRTALSKLCLALQTK